MFTSRETQELSSFGSSSIEFSERLTLVMSLDFHTSDGTAPRPSLAKESS